jgi:hypothetical protein
VERTVSAPDQMFSTTDDAAKWLNVSEETFELVMKRHGIGPSKVTKRKKLWHWLDLVYAVRLIDKFQDLPE